MFASSCELPFILHCEKHRHRQAVQWLQLTSAFGGHLGHVTCENQQSAKAKTKVQISFAVTAKLISAFVFATRMVQFFYFLNANSQPLTIFCDYCQVCVGPVQNPNCSFSHAQAQLLICGCTGHFASDIGRNP